MKKNGLLLSAVIVLNSIYYNPVIVAVYLDLFRCYLLTPMVRNSHERLWWWWVIMSAA